jgi:hypothetical protein
MIIFYYTNEDDIVEVVGVNKPELKGITMASNFVDLFHPVTRKGRSCTANEE